MVLKSFQFAIAAEQDHFENKSSGTKKNTAFSSHRHIKKEQNYIHPLARNIHPYSPRNSSDIDKNRRDALEKCIDDSLSSKNSLRTSRLRLVQQWPRVANSTWTNILGQNFPILCIFTTRSKKVRFLTSLSLGFWHDFRSSTAFWDFTATIHLNSSFSTSFWS